MFGEGGDVVRKNLLISLCNPPNVEYRLISIRLNYDVIRSVLVGKLMLVFGV